MAAPGTHVFRKIGRWCLYIIAVCIVLLLSCWLFLLTPMGKRIVKNKMAAYLEKKLQSKVTIGSLHTNWLGSMELQDVYIEDRQQQPMLQIGKIKCTYTLNGLAVENATLNKISIEHVKLYVYRAAGNPLFNCYFVAAALLDGRNRPFRKWPGDQPCILALKNVDINIQDGYKNKAYQYNVHLLEASIRATDLKNRSFHTDYFISEGLHANVRQHEPAAQEKAGMYPVSVFCRKLIFNDTVYVRPALPVSKQLYPFNISFFIQ